MEKCSSSYYLEGHCSTDTNTNTNTEADNSFGLNSGSSWAVKRAIKLVQSDDLDFKLLGAREIRRLTKTSQRCRRLLSDSVEPLVSMLRTHDSSEACEASLLALLNLAVKDESYVSLFTFFSQRNLYFFVVFNILIFLVMVMNLMQIMNIWFEIN